MVHSIPFTYVLWWVDDLSLTNPCNLWKIGPLSIRVCFISYPNQHTCKTGDFKYNFLFFIKTIQTFVVSYKIAKWLFWQTGSAEHYVHHSEPNLPGLEAGSGNPCFKSNFFIGPSCLILISELNLQKE